MTIYHTNPLLIPSAIALLLLIVIATTGGAASI